MMFMFRLSVLIVVSVLFVSCAPVPETFRVYEGEPRPQDEVATIETWFGLYHRSEEDLFKAKRILELRLAKVNSLYPPDPVKYRGATGRTLSFEDLQTEGGTPFIVRVDGRKIPERLSFSNRLRPFRIEVLPGVHTVETRTVQWFQTELPHSGPPSEFYQRRVCAGHDMKVDVKMKAGRTYLLWEWARVIEVEEKRSYPISSIVRYKAGTVVEDIEEILAEDRSVTMQEGLATTVLETDVNNKFALGDLARKKLVNMGADARLAIPFLISGLEDDRWLVRRYAAYVLGLIGPVTDEVIPALERACQDPVSRRGGVREQAQRALKEIRKKQQRRDEF